MLIKRGDIFYADLNPVVGSEQGGIRLCWSYRIMRETGTANGCGSSPIDGKKALSSYSYSYPMFKSIAQRLGGSCGADTNDRQIPTEKLRGFS